MTRHDGLDTRPLCRFCGADPRTLLHVMTCDGQQGHIEAAEDTLPLLASGLTPETYAPSRAAAESVDQTKAAQRQCIRLAIDASGDEGLSDDDLQAQLGLDGNSERPRRWELWKLGVIDVRRDAEGRALRRPTRAGRSATIWVLLR